jgi:hypothetical protein
VTPALAWEFQPRRGQIVTPALAWEFQPRRGQIVTPALLLVSTVMPAVKRLIGNIKFSIVKR